MGNPLHMRRTAAEWAAAGQVIDISQKLSGFEQLGAVVEEDLAALGEDAIPSGWRDSTINARLEFGFIDVRNSVPMVQCKVSATVDAVCQRCLEAFRLPLEVEAKLLLLGLDETVEGYDEFEVWELTESTLQPLDIVDELLVMSMPFAAMHSDSAACKALEAPVADSEEMTTPFAALREQMTQEQ
jgi:uncharacterized metal-binding protein YceD (DUF177 family)